MHHTPCVIDVARGRGDMTRRHTGATDVTRKKMQKLAVRCGNSLEVAKLIFHLPCSFCGNQETERTINFRFVVDDTFSGDQSYFYDGFASQAFSHQARAPSVDL